MQKLKSLCKTCNVSFTPTKDFKGVFCSRNCHHSSMRKGDRICVDCNEKTSHHKSKRCMKCEGERRKGENHHGWKGALVGYRALHHWVVKELGQPKTCESCGDNGEGHNMHWANKSGEYKREKDDWLRLCPSCHGQYDKERRLLE